MSGAETTDAIAPTAIASETATTAPALAATTPSALDLDARPEFGAVDAFEAGPGDARYTFLDVFARGGLGQIRHAYDHRLGRTIAVKELQRPQPGSAAERRFAREATITARLEHPAIVPVHDLGRHANGEPFYCMKLVDGRSLEEVAAEATTTAARIALLPHLITVAEAIAYAHERRIIHRDLKPANVLVGAFGETWVIDWGLAKRLDEDPDESHGAAPDPGGADHGLTQAGELMGTLAYMPPEQASGEPVDARADVYALGAMLYHVLGGRRPYEGLRVDNFYAHILAHPPTDIARVAPDLPPDLIAVVRTAMARSPADRYPSAKALSEDLRRFLAGRLVQVYRYSTREMLRRWLRRNRALLSTVVGALVLLLAFAAYSFRRIAEQRDEAEAARRVAEDQRGTAERERLRADARTTEIEGMTRSLLKDAGSRALVAGRPHEALPQLLQALALAPDDRALRFMVAEALRPVDALRASLPKQTGGVSSLAVGSGGSRLLVTGGDISLHLWDLNAVAEVATLVEPGAAALQARFDRAGDLVVAFTADGVLRRFDAVTGEPRGEWRDRDAPGDGRDNVMRVLVDHGERTLTARPGAAELRDAATGALLRTYPTPRGESVSLAVALDGAAWATEDGSRLRVWTASRATPLYDLTLPEYYHFAGFGAEPDQLFVEKWFFTVGENTFALLDAKTRKLLALAPCGVLETGRGSYGGGDPSQGLTFLRSADGALIVALEAHGALAAWDAKNGSCRHAWLKDAVGGLHVLPDPEGLSLATTGPDGILALWGPAPATSSEGLSRHVGVPAHESAVVALASVGSGGDLVTAASDGEIKVWRTRPHLSPQVVSAAGRIEVNPGATKIARMAKEVGAPIRVLELSGAEPALDLPFQSGPVQSMAWGDDTTLMVNTDDTIEVWDVATRQRIGRVVPPLRGKEQLLEAFPLPGTDLAVVQIGLPPSDSFDWHSRYEEVTLWRWRDGAYVDWRRLTFPFAVTDSTRDPTRFVLLNRMLLAWPELRWLWPEVQKDLPRYVFPPDGRFIFASGNDGRLTLLDIVTGGTLAELRAPPKGPAPPPGDKPIFFTRAGDRFVVSGEGGLLEIWDYASLQPVGSLRGHSATISAAIFSDDDRFVLTFVDDTEAILWDLEHEVARFRAHPIRTDAFLPIGWLRRPPAPAAFTPDGELLAMVDEARLVFIEPESGLELAREEVPPVRAIFFNSNGDRLYILSHPGSLIEREIRRDDRPVEQIVQQVHAAVPHLALTVAPP